jgi:hypothetical protein
MVAAYRALVIVDHGSTSPAFGAQLLEETGGQPTKTFVGAHDPLQAADDGLREFPADAIVFATHPDGRANWLEEGVVETARRRSSVPVSHVVVDTAD